MPHVTEEIWTRMPGREGRLIVAPWPEATAEYDGYLDALDNAQTAARIYRRSQVRIKVLGDSQRIFEAVVRPSANGKGDVEAERKRVRAEIERGERKLGNEDFVRKAPPDVVEEERRKLEQYRAELDALGD
jgi:valyl-tRNA synthetase